MLNQMTPSALVVDDNFFNRDVCLLALKHVGYEVAEAENGLEAVNLLQGRQFDLLVLDLAMPEMDGIEVLRIISSETRFRDLCVMVMTANSHMAVHEEIERADYVIYKPIDIVDFGRLLERLKQSRSA